MNLILKGFLFVVSAYCLVKFCNHQTEGFTITRIQSNHPFNPEWEVRNPPLLESEKIFSQRFTYLGAGGQCYAFASEDGTYVLKFFKHHLRRLPIWQRFLPKKEARKLKLFQKLKRDFASYKIAAEQLPEETGLLFVHLNKTDSLQQTARLVDKLGIEHRVDLDQIEFVLQKKATPALSHLMHLVEKNDLPAAKESINSICLLILSRCQKGIHDEDAKIHRNFGFLGNKAILIDGGRLVLDPKRQDPEVQTEDLIQITSRLNQFLEELSPELAEYLQSYLQGRKNG